MATAFLFPGQGSQFAGMGQDLYQQYSSARDLFDRANELLGFRLTDTMFGLGDAADAQIKQTHITQPALFTHSLAAFAVLSERGLVPDMTAGHSLGEYSALAAAGAISFAEGLEVVRLRGELMARAGDEQPGTMAAVLGLDDDLVERVCREIREDGLVVQPANFNSPGQVVISGSVDGIEEASRQLRDEGAKRVVPLPVSGAFHSPLMAFAREGLEAALLDLEIRPPSCPVYLNVTGRPSTDVDDIRARLLEQLLAPVRWSDALRAMAADGAFRFIEVGAGSVLSGLARRTLGRDIEVATAGTVADISTLQDEQNHTK